MSGKPRGSSSKPAGPSKTPNARKGQGSSARRIAPAMQSGKLDIAYLLNDDDAPTARKPPGGSSRLDHTARRAGAAGAAAAQAARGSLTCPLCPVKCENRAQLTQHVNTFHKASSSSSGRGPYQKTPHSKGPHKCTECNTSFGEKGNLNRHVRSVHRGEKPWACDQCKLAFPFRDTLTRHVKAVHEHQRPFQCPYCQSKFKKRDHLLRHMSSQHGVTR